MKAENDHVDVHEIRGFAADTLHDALHEAYALSRGTKCRKFLFSLSVNPPPDKIVSTAEFIKAIDRAEKQLGLTGQPRAIVFHEKEGRRHAHCVFSRIDTKAMKAVHMPFTKRTLVDLTRSLFIEHGWKVPKGLIDSRQRDPRNFTHAEYQQAKRAKKDPKAIKQALQSAWSMSDNKASLAHALQERGYWLAKGDKRGFVVLDHKMEIYALSKALGLKTKVIRDRLGTHNDLLSVEETKAEISLTMQGSLSRMQGDIDRRASHAQKRFDIKRVALLKRQKAEREALKTDQERRAVQEAKTRHARFRRGVSGLWDRLRGEHKRVQNINQAEAYEALKRDQNETDDLIHAHLKNRQRIEIFKLRVSEKVRSMQRSLQRDMNTYTPMPEP